MKYKITWQKNHYTGREYYVIKDAEGCEVCRKDHATYESARQELTEIMECEKQPSFSH